MESFGDSNCNSMSHGFSLYERYMRSFNVVDSFTDENRVSEANCEYNSSPEDNAEVDPTNKHYETAEDTVHSDIDVVERLTTDICPKVDEDTSFPALLDHNSADHSRLTEKSDPTDVPTSDDSKPYCFKHPVFITSTMENSNNAVDSIPLFRDVRTSESVFKLPVHELSFNGTLKHVQRLKPIVDPITALTSKGLVHFNDKSDHSDASHNDGDETHFYLDKTDSSKGSTDTNRVDKTYDSTGDSQYAECNKKESLVNDDGSSKWNEQSYSSLEASFDSGVRSPDIFSDEDEKSPVPVQKPFWEFLKDFESYDKKRVRKLEKTLKGVLPPPSITTLKSDVSEMLKKYYCYLPHFNEQAKEEPNTTPTKRVSFINIPIDTYTDGTMSGNNSRSSLSKEISNLDITTDKSSDFKVCSETEARETVWPDLLKCHHYDVYYNLTQYSEKFEQLTQRYRERYIGAETDTSINIYSGGMQSPNSATKRKAIRIKMAQAKSPGRRLSHLARRRQAFCSAATINEKAQVSNAKMVLIDKKKLINSAERKSPRRRTPGKKTPLRKTPGKKTPAKTPKSSNKKKAMRRLLMDPEHVTRSQPRDSLKRALFISPENRKPMPEAPSSSVPVQAMKSKRALFGSPATADTKSCDGTQSDQFLKRKRDLFDVGENSRTKIAKSLSFGGDSIGNTSGHNFSRRASEAYVSRKIVEWNETHKTKLLWAVTEALRVHGWRMSSPGFREKASSLARLTRRMLALPPHAARLAAPTASVSETMLKLARQYVFAIIQGRSVDECFLEEQLKLAKEATKVSGYITATAYQQLKARQVTSSTFTSKIKENFDVSVKQEQPRSTSKNILQDKLVNIDANSNSSSSGVSMLDKSGIFKSNSMPSFEEAAKMRARRQISFDDVDFPKR